MTALKALIKRRITAEGPMSLAEYMGLCLTHPVHGYYTTGTAIGADGDFTTAPEISQMFGELVGLALAQYWLDTGAPDRFTLAELGPGRGTLMADILRATRKVAGFHEAMSLSLVEVSPPLRAQQARALEGFRPTWCDQFEHLAADAKGPLFLVANEFFDALPIRQFLRHEDGWAERVIGLDAAGELVFGLSPATRLGQLEHLFEATAPGELVQMQSGAGFIQSIGRWIACEGGMALIMDYGDWKIRQDTFQAVSGHAYADPLDAPGAADLTAHVDFSDLASDLPAGADGTQLAQQGAFLSRLGIGPRAQLLAEHLDGPSLASHIAAVNRLTSPEEMGSLFKAWAIYKSGLPAPPGLEP